MRKGLEYACAFFGGGVVYALLEILWRGYTHWSMMLAGGICLTILFRLSLTRTGENWFLYCLAGAGIITAVELAAGLAVNLWWGLDVWDYSRMPMNLWGQICPAFSGLWFLLCIPARLVCRGIRRFGAWFEAIGERETLSPAHRQN